jgi:hypothetical protein
MSSSRLTQAGLILSLVRGLWGEVHPQLRQASIEADDDSKTIRLRFEFDGEARGPAQESCSCAATEVISDFPSGWRFDEQYVAAPWPSPLAPLAHVAYRRWESEKRAVGSGSSR